jgi:hypothetical protein
MQEGPFFYRRKPVPRISFSPPQAGLRRFIFMCLRLE